MMLGTRQVMAAVAVAITCRNSYRLPIGYSRRRKMKYRPMPIRISGQP